MPNEEVWMENDRNIEGSDWGAVGYIPQSWEIYEENIGADNLFGAYICMQLIYFGMHL